MPVIRVLDDGLANQIAAGEVVERPASVVKELVENALDARASRIQVAIREGGIQSIEVTDNGIGMERADAELAFERHATSKIRRERDLFSIRSLGFRGEALPSIASVSRLTLTTASDDGTPATCIRLEGGVRHQVEEAVRAQGTTVRVEDLFFNTPARLKYLKTVNTEVSHVADGLGRIALAHPTVAFTLKHNERELFRTTGDGKRVHVVHALYGKQVAKAMLPFSGEDADFRIEGVAGRPELTRSNRSYLTLLVNGRYIRNIPLAQAILRAYDTLLPVGRYPIVVMAITMDPKLVDVNVHPAKLEVRLSKEKELCGLIESTLQALFRREVLIPAVENPWKQKKAPEQKKPVQESLHLERREVKKEKTPTPPPVREWNYPAGVKEAQTTFPVSVDSDRKAFSHSETTPIDSGGKVFTRSEMASPSPEAKVREEPKSSPHPREDKGEVKVNNGAETKPFPALLPLAQIHGTYIVCQAEDGFYLLDQHAAHERIYYEHFYEGLKQKGTEPQSLLIPLTVECGPGEAETLSGWIPTLVEWGVEMEPFGPGVFVIHSHPRWFPQGSEEALIREMVEWLKAGQPLDMARMRDEGAKMMACKAAIKANRHLRREEMESLLEQLAHCERPYTCPHGRPILVHFSTREIEKMFKRVM
ncbi:DNA mismatch repair endonuclease MutL [Desmospora activa]|uniref:DNA mismatch repair protein MutL n=1 Tax=Desmospora activa DSM 45169 TaxID=1121389 RepID=A0A2T4ZAH9_9BACL|nr:DNA mismatch repair endonuclease MutL [Desmospora activa]PTM58893.1 DNA mismatch repair protein MutL [Desmospora activa DSM 45169]